MIVDINMHHFPENLFTNEKLLEAFISCVPRQYGEIAYLSTVPGSDRRQIVAEKPKGYPNLHPVDGAYTLESELAAMDEGGVDLAILRLPVWNMWLPIEVCRIVNDSMADTVKRSGGRLRAVACVPPWATKDCVYELERCVGELGMVGVELSSHYGDLYLDDEAFRPYLKVLNDLNLPVVVHHNELPVDYGSMYSFNNMRRFYGRCVDQATAVGRELFSGIFADFPNLKFIHTCLGGAFYAYQDGMLPRPSATEETLDRFDTDTDIYRSYLKNNLFFDISCPQAWGTKQLECAIGVYGADNVLFGGSFPVRHEWMIQGVDYVKNLDIGDEDKALILGENARKLFNLS
ncbi:amidohydrolase family protein [Nocardia vaccinii]|uniref:amidohydrolase family protein n=1 Tax=Nocardia vaccinii TaxID=1822 RepID=UPI000AB3F89A|nr:amidohydrolase family protein [Nocardia vaccinii]